MKKNSDTTLLLTTEYRQFIEELKSRVLSARLSAAYSVNHELILLYWDIGRGIVEKQKTFGWGDSVVEMVAVDLRNAFPKSSSFSADNVWRMRQFYVAYSAPEFLGQLVPEIRPALQSNISIGSGQILDLLIKVPWGQNLLILKKVTDFVARLWYLRATARFGW